MFFRLSTFELALLVFAVVLGGSLRGRRRRPPPARAPELREPLGVLQGGAARARRPRTRVRPVDGRGPLRRAARRRRRRGERDRHDVPAGADAARADAVALARRPRPLHGYEHPPVELRARTAPRRRPRSRTAGACSGRSGDSPARHSTARPPTARRASTSRASTRRSTCRPSGSSALNNRVPSVVLAFEIIGAAVALGLLAVYLAILSRGVITVVLAAAFVSALLLVTFDLDRPTRGFVQVPDTPLVALRASMELPPAAGAPGTP